MDSVLQSLKVWHPSIDSNRFYELPIWKIGCVNYAHFPKSGHNYQSIKNVDEHAGINLNASLMVPNLKNRVWRIQYQICLYIIGI